MPMIVVKGVRNSWLIVATNCDFRSVGISRSIPILLCVEPLRCSRTVSKP